MATIWKCTADDDGASATEFARLDVTVIRRRFFLGIFKEVERGSSVIVYAYFYFVVLCLCDKILEYLDEIIDRLIIFLYTNLLKDLIGNSLGEAYVQLWTVRD